jgi:hypothetical protein
MTKHPLRQWRESGANDLAALRDLLAPDVVFHSPILARPLQGRDLVMQVMTVSVQVRDGAYTDEFRRGADTLLVWTGTIDGKKLQSFEALEDDAEGRVLVRTVAMRPYPALVLFRAAMYERLATVLPSEYWDEPGCP